MSEHLEALLHKLGSGKIIVAICFLCLAAYSNALSGEFVFDDTEQVVNNPAIRSWDNLGRAFKAHVWAFQDSPEVLRVSAPLPYYRPLFTILLTVEYQFFGLWPQGWHLVSLLLHILCSAGVYCVLLRISERKDLAALAAGIFAVHPVHVESVSWISGVTDPLYAVFFLPAFCLYLKYRSERRHHILALSMALFALSVLSKETALTFVLLVFLYEFIESGPASFGQRLMMSLRQALPYLLVTVLYLVPRYAALGGLAWENPNGYKGTIVDVFLTLPLIICSYLLHLIWPIRLSVAYDTHFVTTPASPEFFLPAIAILLVVTGLVAFRKKISRRVWHGLVWLFVPLIPVLDLRQLAVEYLVFDRYLYLSVAGWSFLISLGVAWLMNVRRSVPARQPVPVYAGVAVLAIGLIIGTARENRAWADSYSLWSNATRVRPEFWAAHYNLGLALIDQRRFDEALESLDRAALLGPNEPVVYDALGRTYDIRQDGASAVVNFKRAIALDPTMFESLNNLGTVYFKSGEYEAAEDHFASALELKPQALAARFNLGMCYARMGKYGDSTRQFELVLQAAPDDAETYYQLGEVYRRSGRFAESSETFRRGLSLARSDVLAQKISEGMAVLAKQASADAERR